MILGWILFSLSKLFINIIVLVKAWNAQGYEGGWKDGKFEEKFDISKCLDPPQYRKVCIITSLTPLPLPHDAASAHQYDALQPCDIIQAARRYKKFIFKTKYSQKSTF